MADAKVSQLASGAPALAADEIYIARAGGLPRKLTLAEALALRGSPPNAVVNGAASIAQKALSQNLTTLLVYGSLDRWAFCQVGAAANGGAGQTGSILVGFPNSFFIRRNNAATQTGNVCAVHVMESRDAIRLAGKQATLSVYVAKDSNFSGLAGNFAVQVISGTGNDQTAAQLFSGWSGATFLVNATPSAATAMRHSFTFTVPTTCTQLGIVIFYTPTGTAGVSDILYFTDVRLHEGPDIANYNAYRPYEQELALCQRWFWKSFQYGTAVAQASGDTAGALMYVAPSGGNTNFFHVPVRFPVQMRAAPTVTFYNPVAANAKWRNITIAADSSGSAATANHLSADGFTAINQQVVGDLTNNSILVHAAASAEL